VEDHSQAGEDGRDQGEDPDKRQGPDHLLEETGWWPSVLPQKVLRFVQSDKTGRDREQNGGTDMERSYRSGRENIGGSCLSCLLRFWARGTAAK
jgi:hypothetical protein